MRYLPSPLFTDEHQRGALFPVNDLAPGVETVVQNEGRDPNLAKDVDLQGLSPHLQILGGSQSVVLSLSPGGGVQPFRRGTRELLDTRAGEVIAGESVEILPLRRLQHLLQASLDLGCLGGMVRRQVSGAR